jgi:hypothetical protein
MAKAIKVLGGLLPIDVSPSASKRESPLDTGIVGISGRLVVGKVAYHLLAVFLGDDTDEWLITADGETRMMYWSFWHSLLLQIRATPIVPG